MYAIMQQVGTDQGHRHYLEHATDEEAAILSSEEGIDLEPTEVKVMYRRREDAEAAASRIAREMGMPPDSSPELWGNIAAREPARRPLYYVIRQ